MPQAFCSEPHHATRTGRQGWDDGPLCTVTNGPVDSYYCAACSLGRVTEAIVDATDARTRIAIYQNGAVDVSAIRRYSDGTSVGVVQSSFLLSQMVLANALTPAERSALVALLVKLRDYGISHPG